MDDWIEHLRNNLTEADYSIIREAEKVVARATSEYLRSYQFEHEYGYDNAMQALTLCETLSRFSKRPE